MVPGICACGCGEPAPIAARNHTAKGWVKGEPLRFRPGHNNRRGENNPRRPLEERLLAKINKDAGGGCWEWVGALSNGYGMIWDEDRNEHAHRVAYRLWKGPVDDVTVYVCHHCDNRRCCNPDHLFLGTAADNTRDALKKGRFCGLRHERGARNNRAKLNPDAVRTIRAMARDGRPYKEIGAVFGIHPEVASKVARRLVWAQVD